MPVSPFERATPRRPRPRAGVCCARRALRLAAVAWALAGPAAAQTGAPVLLDNMDSGEATLTLENPGATIRLLRQSITHEPARFGSAAESIVLSAPPGEAAQVAYRLPPAPVIDDLMLTAWIRVNRPGARLAARVVLPHSKAPGSDQPQRLLVYGQDQAPADRWQRLTLTNLRPAVERQARVVRATQEGPGNAVEEHGAYVDALVVLCPGGQGATEVLVDQVAMFGVLRDSRTVGATAAGAAAGQRPAAKAPPLPPLPPVPLAPRVIQWQGEPFATLKQLGFDAAMVARLPSADELADARRAGLFLICPPPAMQSVEAIGPEYDIVLAWDFGVLRASIDEAADLEAWAGWLQRTDPQRERRTLIRPGRQVREASRLADALVLDRPTLGATQTLSGYSTWLLSQSRIARPGTPLWVLADSHYGGRAAAQLAAVRSSRPPVIPGAYSELFRWTASTFTSRPAAFCFRSEASLVGTDRGNRLRAATLELLNLRLQLVEPWLARCKQMSRASCTYDDVTAIVLQTERSHLVVPTQWYGPTHTQSISVEHPLAMQLRGVPETAEAYLLTGVSAQRLRTQRVAGGLRVTVEQLPGDALILLTEDGRAFTQVESHLRRHARRVVDLRLQIVELKRQQAVETLQLLPQPLVAGAEVQGALHRVAALTKAAQDAAAVGDWDAAYDAATEADALLDQLEEATVDQVAVAPAGVSPLPLRWAAAPDHVRLAAALARGAGAWQMLPGGEFEDLSELLRLGWRHLEQPLPGVTSAVRLSPDAPHRGGFCLELDAGPEQTANAPLTAPSVPVWVTSPPIALPPGSLLEITGMVRTSQPLLGPDEALLAFDTLGGEHLALRLQRAPTWQPLRMMRLTGGGGETRITLALDGFGRVQVDSLVYRITPLGSPAAAEPVRLEARNPPQTRR